MKKTSDGYIIGFHESKWKSCNCTPPYATGVSDVQYYAKYPDGTYWMCQHGKTYLAKRSEWWSMSEMTFMERRRAWKFIRANTKAERDAKKALRKNK